MKLTMKLRSLSSRVSVISRITSRNAWERQMYSDLQLLSATWDCSLDSHKIEQLLIVITYPDLDFAVLGSNSAVSLIQLPEKSASAQTSKDLFLLGLMIIPCCCVPFKYLPRYMTASIWDSFGSEQNIAHWCTAYAMLGLVLFSKKFNFQITFL